MKPVIVSGIKPTGRTHIGNYLGMAKLAAELQNSGKYEPLFFIADYHAMTEKVPASEMTRQTLEIAADLIASGIDPKKSVLFVQSHVPEHANLAWILSTVTSMGDLERMVEYKEKVADGQTPNAGLFNYPVLMAADILIYKAGVVPVGEDQRQHLELTRAIARNFNARFGETFPEPKAAHTSAPRVMSLDDASRKMSKSIASGCIYLTDTPDEIRAKVARAQTDSMSEVGYDPEKRPAIANLLRIYSEFSGKPIETIVAEFKGKKYVEFKTALAEVIIAALIPFQEKRAELLKNPKKLASILASGAKKASKIAEATMKEVREKTGLI
ncbi:MAG: tryptophan--tRNA ligase [Candidatus Colwellbacteria bacterium RIFCSPLOWO2_01_FULL_48_10]|uniref:Tryptophan--tRNA ligase n=1 Tax=Candidatus Colwellbacteria bacterium RIFCSPLOWO2_01_FULL_48_10 TaxID=1797690 RepID=A0A1G1Z6S1_9BACT|nr:MAG: tryptophan--tRNA ligase [Candidatus Colwellbacteria bacterium RIFCSPLOWO2_01_FULL_48_10]